MNKPDLIPKLPNPILECHQTLKQSSNRNNDFSVTLTNTGDKKMLVFKNPKAQDAGTYTCKARFQNTISLEVRVNVKIYGMFAPLSLILNDFRFSPSSSQTYLFCLCYGEVPSSCFSITLSSNGHLLFSLKGNNVSVSLFSCLPLSKSPL